MELSPEQIKQVIRQKWRDDKRVYRAKKKQEQNRQ
jgi:hypothetical protein